MLLVHCIKKPTVAKSERLFRGGPIQSSADAVPCGETKAPATMVIVAFRNNP